MTVQEGLLIVTSCYIAATIVVRQKLMMIVNACMWHTRDTECHLQSLMTHPIAHFYHLLGAQHCESMTMQKGQS